MKRLNVVSIQMVREKSFPYEVSQICSPGTAVDILRKYIGSSDREILVMIGLDTKNKINVISTISIGSLSASLAHPREIFKAAILANCASIILGHNHPSNDTRPSQEDIKITERVAAAGEVLGIELLDHVIIGEDNHYSMKEHDQI
jgi:DNA repair protein RadC